MAKRRHQANIGKVASKKRTQSKSGGRKGSTHSAKPGDLREEAPSSDVVVRQMTDEDRARFEARRHNKA